MDKNYQDKEFAKLTAQLKDLENVDDPTVYKMTLAHLSDFCDVLSGLTCHINRYITRALSEELDSPPPIPGEIAIGFIAGFDIMSDLMSEMCELVCGSDFSDEEEINE